MAYTTINKPSEYFNTVLYTGNNSTQSITGVGFQPDFSWIKCRNAGFSNLLFDVRRGATYFIKSNSTDAEASNVNFITSFDSDGFSLGNDSAINGSGNTYASWNWLGGGTGVSNTDGSITSTVSANTTSGFSIVTWSGTSSNGTIGHGLGVAPKVIICFGYSSGTNSWTVGHNSLSWNHIIYLEATAASTVSNSAFWQNTAPTNNVFSVGSFSGTNSSQSMIAYCFAEKKGYSKFGSYTGNGNADGTFIYTGFKPALFILKESNGTNSWQMFDNKRPSYNLTDKYLKPNESSAEVSGNNQIDMLSNGIKLRSSNTGNNGSGQSFIYMAFAENPLVGTNGVPATAR
jgi:hypothetical protein